MVNTLAPSPNMQLVLPVVLGEVGPLWASELNTALGTTVDAHDHTTGKGVQVPSAGLNINADLSYAGFGPVAQGYSRFSAIVKPAGAKTVTVFAAVQSGRTELFYEDSTGADVQLTSGGAITPNGTGLANGFIGAYAGNASAYYDNTAKVFAFYQTATPTYDTSSHAIVAASAYQAVSSGAYFQLINRAESASRVSGWRQSASATTANWLLSLDGALTGTYTYNALYAISSASNTSSRVTINPGTSLTPGPSPLNVCLQATAGGLADMVSILPHVFGSGLGQPGSRIRFYGPTTADSAVGVLDGTVLQQGEIQFRWTGAGFTQAGVTILDTLGSGTPVLQSDGTGHYGIGVAYSASQAITLGGTTVAASNTYNMGASGTYFANGYFSQTNTNSVVNSAVTSSIALGSDISVTVANGQAFKPATGSQDDLGTAALPWRGTYTNLAVVTDTTATPASISTVNALNLITAHAGVPAAGGTTGRVYNVTSVTAAGAGVYNIVFSTAMNVGAHIMVTGTAVNDKIFKAVMASTTTATVTSFTEGGAGVNTDFSFIVVGG